MGQLTKTLAELNKLLTPSQISVYLASPDTHIFAGTGFEKLEFTMTDGTIVDFTPRGTPDFDFVFTGLDGSMLLFVGDADLRLSGSTDTVEFALFKNGVEQAKFTSKTYLASASDIEGFGSNGLVPADNGDVFDIRAKCGTSGKTLTVENMKVTLLLVEIT